MTAFTNPMAQALLDLLFLNTDIANIGDATGIQGSTAAGSWYLDLLTAWPGQAGPSGDEMTYTGYTQNAIGRTGSDWTRSSQTISNDNDLSFGKKTDAGTETASYWGIRRTAAAATYDFIGPLALEQSQPFVCDDSASPDYLIAPGHTYSDDDQVQLLSVVGASLPSGLSDGDIVYVISSAADQFQVSLTVGGGAIALGNGAGRVAKVLTKTIAQNDTPQIDATDLQITLD